MTEAFGALRKVDVSARAFAAAMLATHDDFTRFYLTGVHVSPCKSGGVLLVATNGHILIAIHDETGTTDGSWICPLPEHMRRFLIANMKSRDDQSADDEEYLSDGSTLPSTILHRKLDRLQFTGTEARLTQLRITDDETPETVFGATAAAIDGEYPDWRKVLPKLGHSCAHVVAASQYLTLVGRAASIFNNSATTGLTICQPGKVDQPLFVMPYTGPHNGCRMVAVIMPMRAHGEPVIPEWLNP